MLSPPKDKSKIERDVIIVEEISEILSKTRQIYDYLIGFIQNDISYLEKLQKFLTASCNALDFSQQPEMIKLSEQQSSAFVMVSLYSELKNFSSLFSTSTYDQFKKIINTSTKKSQEFDSFCKTTIRGMKTAFSNFHSLKDTYFQNLSSLTPDDYFSTILQNSDISLNNSESPNRLKSSLPTLPHMMYRNIYNSISTSEQKIFHELDNIDQYIVSALQDENKLLSIFTKKINKVILFDLSEFPTKCRTLPENQTVSYFKDNLIKKFYQLKSFSAPHEFSPQKAFEYESDEIIKPFYARVWKNYEKKTTEEISVKKKEIVFVIRTTPYYWYIIKQNKEQGYLPIEILEPLDDPM